MDRLQMIILIRHYRLMLEGAINELEDTIPDEFMVESENPVGKVFGMEIKNIHYPITQRLRDILDIMRTDLETLEYKLREGIICGD